MRGMETRVTDNPQYGRYEVRVDGELAGFTLYRDRGEDRISLTHTEVFDEFEGRGVGSALVAGTLDDLRSNGLAVLPVCPFVRAYIRDHPEYLDLVPESERSRFEL
jgi:predicted GNAT family acetyltransferase